jgi:hypothetical protein
VPLAGGPDAEWADATGADTALADALVAPADAVLRLLP